MSSDSESHESSTEEHEYGQQLAEGTYPNAASNRLINKLFQDILNSQEETLLTNFNILMEDLGIMDIQTKDDMMQDQFRELVAALTQEFVEIFTDKSDKVADEFCRCAICFGDEEPYLKLNCACKIMLHRECYIEYLEHDRKLSCPICKASIFQNYLKE